MLKQVAGYELLSDLGEGGMGVVYLARNRAGEHVARVVDAGVDAPVADRSGEQPDRQRRRRRLQRDPEGEGGRRCRVTRSAAPGLRWTRLWRSPLIFRPSAFRFRSASCAAPL